MGNSRRKVNPVIPDDLVMEILIRLPRRQVARFRCVCKSWRGIIRSPQFKSVYDQTSQRGLLLYRFEPPRRDGKNYTLPLHTYHSRISDEQEDDQLEFISQHRFGDDYKSSMYRIHCMTTVVNGLICVEYHDRAWLNIYNVCTGEKMRFPAEIPYHETVYADWRGEVVRPIFHLGYHPSSGRYKILRLTADYPRHAHIMTLRPSTSPSTWEPIKFGEGDYIPPTRVILGKEAIGGRKVSIPSNDGFMCWFLPEQDLILFDFGKERFQKISLHVRCAGHVILGGDGFLRAQFDEHQQRLVVSVWVITRFLYIKTRGLFRRLECFVMDDDEGKRWSQHSVDFPPQLDQKKAVFVVPTGSLMATSSATEIVVINTTENDVYCYDHTNKMQVAQFRVGRIPELPVDPLRLVTHHKHYSSQLSCVRDAKTLHLPLDDILSASK